MELMEPVLIAYSRDRIKNITVKNELFYAKYLDVDRQIKEKLKIIKSLKLDLFCPIGRFLDISTGCGWLPWVLKNLGHDVVYTDNISSRFLLPQRMREALGLNECINFFYGRSPENERCKDDPGKWHFKKLSDIQGKFTGIFALSVSPHSYFDEQDWRLFIEDCRSYLNPSGFIYIRPNFGKGRDELIKVVKGEKSLLLNQGFLIYGKD